MITRLLVALPLFLGCGSDEHNDRALFLKLLDDYRNAPDAARDAPLAALRRFRPQSAKVRTAHGACLGAYGNMERAETEHTRAKHLLAEVEAGRRSLPATQPVIEKALAASNEAVATARDQIAQCTRLVDDLRLHAR